MRDTMNTRTRRSRGKPAITNTIIDAATLDEGEETPFEVD